MFRDEKYIYFNTKGYGGCHEEYENRRKKKSELIEDLNEKIFHLKNDIKRLTLRIEQKHPEGNEKKLKEKKEALRKASLELENLKSTKEFIHSPLKKSTKKRNKKWIKIEILKIIEEAKSENIYFLTKEDVAHRLQVKEYQVEQIFVELNKEGILSQPKHKALHDTNRDPGGFDNWHGWAADIYYIRKK